MQQSSTLKISRPTAERVQRIWQQNIAKDGFSEPVLRRSLWRAIASPEDLQQRLLWPFELEFQ
ncbi:MAG TPA: hypothetical protein VGG97_00085 [Bryobacteraceae bacterium]